ncbi:MAG: hypothetical protein U0235_19280 [Polyangiaceae bacterium]
MTATGSADTAAAALADATADGALLAVGMATALALAGGGADAIGAADTLTGVDGIGGVVATRVDGEGVGVCEVAPPPNMPL